MKSSYKLRELARGDIQEINSWRASRELVSNLGAPYRFIGLEIDERWFESYLDSRSSCVRCVAVDAAGPETPLSLGTLAQIDWVNRSCEFHIMVCERAQGRGIGRFTAEGLVRHAFEDLNLRRIELGVLATNERAGKLYESLGFELEGTKRKAIYKGGSWVDMNLMALLRS